MNEYVVARVTEQHKEGSGSIAGAVGIPAALAGIGVAGYGAKKLINHRLGRKAEQSIVDKALRKSRNVNVASGVSGGAAGGLAGGAIGVGMATKSKEAAVGGVARTAYKVLKGEWEPEGQVSRSVFRLLTGSYTPRGKIQSAERAGKLKGIGYGAAGAAAVGGAGLAAKKILSRRGAQAEKAIRHERNKLIAGGGATSAGLGGGAYYANQ